jgi:hypothetical protein
MQLSDSWKEKFVRDLMARNAGIMKLLTPFCPREMTVSQLVVQAVLLEHTKKEFKRQKKISKERKVGESSKQESEDLRYFLAFNSNRSNDCNSSGISGTGRGNSLLLSIPPIDSSKKRKRNEENGPKEIPKKRAKYS